MRILIVYGSTEGHTRDLAQFAARCVADMDEVTICDAAASRNVDLRAVEVIFLAASLHVGHYQSSVVQFAREHHEILNNSMSAFISVSLSAAGENADEWEGLEQCLARFLHETMWAPKAVHQAAGAIRYSHYYFFKRLALKYIASRHGMRTVTSRDYDLTNYDALRNFVISFARGATVAGSPDSRRGQSPADRAGAGR